MYVPQFTCKFVNSANSENVGIKLSFALIVWFSSAAKRRLQICELGQEHMLCSGPLQANIFHEQHFEKSEYPLFCQLFGLFLKKFLC